MKDTLKELGWKLLGLSVLPLAKLAVKGLVALVNKSPQQHDNEFLVSLAKGIIEKRDKGEI